MARESITVGSLSHGHPEYVPKFVTGSILVEYIFPWFMTIPLIGVIEFYDCIGSKFSQQ